MARCHRRGSRAAPRLPADQGSGAARGCDRGGARVGYRSVADLARRAGLGRPALETLAAADAFGSLGLDRRRALWRDPRPRPGPLAAVRASRGSRAGAGRDAARSPARRAGRGRLPNAAAVAEGAVAELRPRLARNGYLESRRIAELPQGRRVKAAGVVVTRQRPGSANGVIFITLEDETGNANLIVWPKTFERFRRIVLQSTMIGVEGPVQRDGIVVHVLAERLVALDRLLGRLSADVAASSAQDRSAISRPVARFPLNIKSSLRKRGGFKTPSRPPHAPRLTRSAVAITWAPIPIAIARWK